MGEYYNSKNSLDIWHKVRMTLEEDDDPWAGKSCEFF